MVIETQIKDAVKEHYTRSAAGDCCGGDSCCGDVSFSGVETEAQGGTVQFPGIPSFGCGTPVEAAALRPGEVVLDLGSGRGLDAFRAAQRIGPGGRVLGVDMTPAMVERAREDARRLGFNQVEFRLGEIERLPVANATIGVVLSNCVLNLVPDKDRAFAEAFRVLAPGGRLVISDMVRAWPRSDEPADPARWAACIDGADPERVYLERMRHAGFTDVEVLSRGQGEVYSLTVRARKP
ncbi:MAG: methyltransferase domain-containing protein [Armatimonadetes bacterium]|nr:methyltransferase domain-containing protein [Armatimonadota bacterium]